MFAERVDRTRAAMAERGVDVLLVSVGADLPWLCGYEAMPLERLTLLIVPRKGDARLLVPFLEAPRVVERPGAFEMLTWRDGEDPIALASGLVGAAGTAAIGDQTWAGFLVDLTSA
ncbi:MAG: aminopeptidase P family protein, partial [Actinomycetia bacterium]|nr:aminopeptidase P family protein [Actinomycetes bacterium]